MSGKMFKGLSFFEKEDVVKSRRCGGPVAAISFHHADRMGLKTQSNHFQQQVYIIFSVLLSVHYQLKEALYPLSLPMLKGSDNICLTMDGNPQIAACNYKK